MSKVERSYIRIRSELVATARCVSGGGGEEEVELEEVDNDDDDEEAAER